MTIKRLEDLLGRLEEPASQPTITTLLLTDANTEYVYQFPKGCKKFLLQVRDATALRIATQKGKVANSNEPYFTLKAGDAIWDDHLGIDDPERTLLYLACGSTDKVVEIWAWT